MSGRLKIIYWSTALTGILISVCLSIKMRWVGDDIFIALRYVKNFVEGNGLVYNAGEQVEGYTDFLWLMLISLFVKFNGEPETIVQILGILFSAGTLIIFSGIGNKLMKESGRFIPPFITLGLALNYDYNVWATGGLEVSFVTFLVSSAFYVYFFTRYSFHWRLFISGLFLTLGLMTRPDIMVVILILNALLFLKGLINKESVRKIAGNHLYFNLFVLIFYVPYFLWRYNYYGYIFPNTYYVKLGYESAFKQGFIYLWLFFKCHFTTLLFVLPVFLFVRKIKLESFKALVEDKQLTSLCTLFIVVVIYLFGFVAKVGGDFMYGRFIIICVPFLYFIIVQSLIIFRWNYINWILLVLTMLSFIESKIRSTMFIEAAENGSERPLFPYGIADERYCYLYFTDTNLERRRGVELDSLLGDINYKAIIYGGQARFAYYANFKYCQEYFGLTDTLIAHSEIPERGRIGHEKHGTVDYFENKGIHFSFNASPLKEEPYRIAYMSLPSGKVQVEIITYDTGVMKQVENRLGKNFNYVDFPQYIDGFIADSLADYTSFEKLNVVYNKFYSYYFKNNSDSNREQLITQKLSSLQE